MGRCSSLSAYLVPHPAGVVAEPPSLKNCGKLVQVGRRSPKQQGAVRSGKFLNVFAQFTNLSYSHGRIDFRCSPYMSVRELVLERRIGVDDAKPSLGKGGALRSLNFKARSRRSTETVVNSFPSLSVWIMCSLKTS